jgi:hypothetical protein
VRASGAQMIGGVSRCGAMCGGGQWMWCRGGSIMPIGNRRISKRSITVSIGALLKRYKRVNEGVVR